MLTRAFCLDRAMDCDGHAEETMSEDSRRQWRADAEDWRAAAEDAEAATETLH